MIELEFSVAEWIEVRRDGSGHIANAARLGSCVTKTRMEDAMAEIDTALAANREAVDQLIRAGERSGAAWSTPRAPGKWSPSQIVEHIARGLDEGANVVTGRSTLPIPPAVVRLIAHFMFKRVLRKAAFPKGFKAHKSMNPASGPATPAEGRIRLETAYQKFDEACRRIVADGRPVISAFGSVPAEDFVRFNELHTRHHSKQMAARQ